jgi:hypothetical protein
MLRQILDKRGEGEARNNQGQVKMHVGINIGPCCKWHIVWYKVVDFKDA